MTAVGTGEAPDEWAAPAWRATDDGLLRPGGLALTDRLVDLAKLPPGSTILDVGCGLGTAVRHLAARGFVALGIDASLSQVAEARRRAPSATYLVADAAALPFESGSIDAVLAECSWSACGTEPGGADAVLSAFARAVRPGGWLLLSDLYAREGDGAGRLRSEAGIRAAVAAAGFAIEHWEDRSSDLRTFAAKLTWEHGSLAPFVGCGGLPAEPAAFKALRPGYFLVVARRAG